ncbi:acyl-ACP--UDP-N-acetylglucosamine O-acyltransferase [Verrucomicrobiota bacterium]
MIHKTAVIEPEAELGVNVTVGPFSYIDKDVRIGDGCVIGPHVSILKHTSIGSGCEIHSGAVLGDLPQDTEFEKEESFVSIGSNCIIRECVTVHRGTKTGTTTEIGDECFLMAFSHCAHNVKLARGVILANGALLAGYVEAGERVFISGNVLVHQFVKIGRLAMLGGACGISKDVPPFCTIRPLAANVILGLNVVGMRRAALTPDERKQVKQAFNILYKSGLNVMDATNKIKNTFSSGPALEFCDFIEKSERGICRFSSDQ